VIRATGFVHLRPDAPPDAADRLVQAVRDAPAGLALAVDAARTAPMTRGGGDVMLLAAFRDEDECEASRHHPYVETVIRPLLDRLAAHVEGVRYTQGPVVVQDPAIRACIQRTLLVRVDPATDPAAVIAFERDLADMTRYIGAIRNSSLSRVDAVSSPLGPTFTHVWEQEFETLEGLTGPYMQHAYHWSLVDTWFDPQAPNQIVDQALIHAACDLRHSILALAEPGES
jgi:hypothetical protein